MTPDEERLMASAVDRDDPACRHEVYASDREVMVMSTSQAVPGRENRRPGEKAHATMPRRQCMVLQGVIPKGDTVVVEVTMTLNEGSKGFGCGARSVGEGPS
jgi:hypothetical protein